MLLLLIVLLLSGCFSQTQPVHVSQTPADVWRLVEPSNQKQILFEKYDRSRLREAAGDPTIDDGEEWVYVAKFEDSNAFGVPLGEADGFIIYATTFNPAWKVIVVTFDTQGKVQRIRIGSADSAVADMPPAGYFLGAGFYRPMRMRAKPATQTTMPFSNGG